MNLKLANTLYLDSKITKELIDPDFIKSEEVIFRGVKLSFNSKPEINYFNSIENAFQFGENRDNYYCYLEDNRYGVFILEKEINKQNYFIGGKKIYNINHEWNLFLNSKNDITVQKNKSPFTTIRFKDFPSNEYFFTKLSSLYYCLRNHSFTTKKELETLLQSLINFPFN